MKQTTSINTNDTTNINTKPNTINNTHIKKNIHTSIINTYPNDRKHNKIQTPYHSTYVTTRDGATRCTFVQLRTNKCPILHSYLNQIHADKHPSQRFPIYKTEQHTTHLSNCIKINTQLTLTDLWTCL